MMAIAHVPFDNVCSKALMNNRSFVYKAKEGRHVRICVIILVFIKAFEQTLSKGT
jgi:hypothetical protein